MNAKASANASIRISVAAAIAATIWSSGCAGKNPALAPSAGPQREVAHAAPPPPPPRPAPPSSPTLSDEEWFRAASLEELQARLSDVYFDYDLSQLRSEARSTIGQNAQWLVQPYNTLVIEVEGHCDERGTEGYNLALGERRSRSVVEYLTSLGMSRDRIRFVTYGKERPLCTDVGENCWWKNRRAHFRVASKGVGYSDE